MCVQQVLEAYATGHSEPGRRGPGVTKPASPRQVKLSVLPISTKARE